MSSFLVLFVLGVFNLAMASEFKKVEGCSKVKSDRMIYLVKQWHLAPGVDTTNLETAKKLPQFSNQSEIFSEVDQWVNQKKIDTAIAEGCEGELDSKFKGSFNGWTFDSLTKELAGKKFSTILTHALLKAEVKHGDQLKTLCGDDLNQIKYAQLALSDLRGDIGYWQRIVENEKNPVKLKIYLDGVNEMLKLPSTTDVSTALLEIKKDVLASFKKFNEANAERNSSLIKAIKSSNSKKPILVVYGGLHAEDIKTKIESEKWNCEVYEPKSYKNNEEKLLDEFKKITQ